MDDDDRSRRRRPGKFRLRRVFSRCAAEVVGNVGLGLFPSLPELAQRPGVGCRRPDKQVACACAHLAECRQCLNCEELWRRRSTSRQLGALKGARERFSVGAGGRQPDLVIAIEKQLRIPSYFVQRSHTPTLTTYCSVVSCPSKQRKATPPPPPPPARPIADSRPAAHSTAQNASDHVYQGVQTPSRSIRGC